LTYLERGQGRAECRERPIDPGCIVGIGTDEHVEVLRCTRMPMERDGMAAEHDEVGTRIGELDE
jgi:hypothetical protein